MEDIILLGLGGHAHSVVDSIEWAGKYNIIGFLDTKEMQGKHYKDYYVLDTAIGAFSHIAVGSVMCGGVLVGQQTFIGANATVIQEKVIGNYCIIGAGTIVKKDIEDRSMIINHQKPQNAGGYKYSSLIGCVA